MWWNIFVLGCTGNGKPLCVQFLWLVLCFFFFCDLTDSSLELYVLIHNLDSQMLRGERSQQILAQLSSLPSVYLIASIDHINAPLSESPWAWCSKKRRICILLRGCWVFFICSCITLDVQNWPGDVCMVVAARSPDWDCGLVEAKLYKDTENYQSIYVCV